MAGGRERRDAVAGKRVGARGDGEERAGALVRAGAVRLGKAPEPEERRAGEERRAFAQGGAEDAQGLAADGLVRPEALT